MSGTTGVVQTLGILIIIVILLFIFFQVYKKLNEPPTESKPPSETQPAGPDAKSGDFGGPGGATDVLPWYMKDEGSGGMYAFMAVMAADFLGKKFSELAEERTRRALDEKARAEADRIARAQSDIENRMRNFEKSNIKKLEERLRKQQRDRLTDANLTDDDIRRRVADETESKRRALEEKLRKQQIETLSDARLTDTDIQRRVTDEIGKQRNAFDEKLRKQQFDTLTGFRLTDADIQTRVIQVEKERRVLLDEYFRKQQFDTVSQARLTDADIRARVDEINVKQFASFEEKLRTQQFDRLSEARLTDADIEIRVSLETEKRRKVLEERLRRQQIQTLSEARLTDADIQKRVTTETEKRRKVLEEKLRKQQIDRLSEARLTDADIRARVEDMGMVKRYEELLRNEQTNKLRATGLTESDIQTRVARVDESKRSALDEKLRKQQIDTLSQARLTDLDIQTRVAQVDRERRALLDEYFRKQKIDTLSSARLTDANIQDRVTAETVKRRASLDEKLRKQQIDTLSDVRLTDANIQDRVTTETEKRRASVDEKLRKQQIDTLSGSRLTDTDIRIRVEDVYGKQIASFEERIRAQQLNALTEARLTDVDIQNRVATETEKRRKTIDEKLRKQQFDALSQARLTDADIRARVAQAESERRALLDEHFREERIKTLSEARLTDVDIRARIDDMSMVKRYEEMLRKQNIDTVTGASLTESEIQTRVAQVERERRVLLDEYFRKQQIDTLTAARLTDADIRGRIDDMGMVKRYDELLRKQQFDRLSEARLTDENIKLRVAAETEKRRSVFEERLRKQQLNALSDARLTDTYIQGRVTYADENQRMRFEERLRDAQQRALSDARLTDVDIGIRVSLAEQKRILVVEERLRRQRFNLLSDANLTDADIRARVAAVEARRRLRFEENLRMQRQNLLYDANLTETNIQSIIARISATSLDSMAENLRRQQSRLLSDARITDTDLTFKVDNFKRFYEKTFDERLRSKQMSLLFVSNLTDAQIQKRVADAEASQRSALEEKLRKQRSDVLTSRGLSDAQIRDTVFKNELEKIRKTEEKLRTEQTRILSDANLTDVQIQTRVSKYTEQRQKVVEEYLRAKQADLLTATGYSDDHVRKVIEERKAKLINMSEEQLRFQIDGMFNAKGITVAELRARVAEFEMNFRRSYERIFKNEQTRLLSNQDFVRRDVIRRIRETDSGIKATIDEKFRQKRLEFLTTARFTNTDIQNKITEMFNKYGFILEERLRTIRAGMAIDTEIGLLWKFLRKYSSSVNDILNERIRTDVSRKTGLKGLSITRTADGKYKLFQDERIRTVGSLNYDISYKYILTTKGALIIIKKILDITVEKVRSQISEVYRRIDTRLSPLAYRRLGDAQERAHNLLEERKRLAEYNARRPDYTNPNSRMIRQHTRTTSVQIRELVSGTPKRGSDGLIDTSKPAYPNVDGNVGLSLKGSVAFSRYQELVYQNLISQPRAAGHLSRLAETLQPAIQQASTTRGANLLAVAAANPEVPEPLPQFTPSGDVINPAKETLRKAAVTKAFKALGAGFNVIGDVLDFVQVAMTFTDAAFYNQFPDESALFTSDRMDGYSTFSLTSQLDLIGTYNDRINRQNQDTTAYGYPFAHVQFPLINGPLSQVDINTPGFEGDVYYNQVRVETEIDAAREYLLRTMEPFKSSIRSTIDSYYGPGTSNAISVDMTDSFVNYLNRYDSDFIPLSDRDRDSLYELAYSNVCMKYDGVVYVDYYKTDPIRKVKPRKRFQCGFKTPAICNANTVKWYDGLMNGKPVGGEYGEWYTFSELLAKTKTTSTGTAPILASNTFESYTLGGNVYVSDQTLLPTVQQGACMIMSSALYSICYSTTKEFQSTYKVDPIAGTGYDFTTHKCQFTPAYCQSLGTCYSRKNKTCELPTETLNGVSMIFGTGGPREFIRLHGCTTEDGLGQTDPLQVARSGFGVIYNALHRMDDWGPGLKASLASPTGSLIFATAVMGTLMFVNKSKFEQMGKTTQKITGRFMMGTMLSLMILIAVESLDSVYAQRSAPVADPLDYTVGGWRTESGVKTVRPMSFLDGWVTKPILYHPAGQMTQPYASVNQFPVKSAQNQNGVVVSRTMFNTQLSGSDLRSRLSTCLPDTQAVQQLQEITEFATTAGGILSGFSGVVSGSMACPTQFVCYKDAPGYPQYSFIRASSDANTNQMYCIQPFPIMNSAQDLSDPTIGPLAGPSTAWLTSNIWTSGEDSGTPTYPMDSATRGPTSQNRWYYQLVYDKKKLNRSVIWDDAKLSKYFDGITINNIRQSTCSEDFFDNKPVDPRCFGFLQVSVSSYKFSPMTIMGSLSNITIPGA